MYAKNQICRCPTYHTKRAVLIRSFRRRPYQMKPTAVGFISLTTVNTRVFKLPDFVHWGSYYWRQPGRQAGGQQSLRQLLSSGLELCLLALLQLLRYRAQHWALGTPYGFNTNWKQGMDPSFAHYQGRLTTRPFSYSLN